MEIVYNSCCGIDVHKNKIVACLKVKGKQNAIKEFSGQTEDIRTMANWLMENKCEKIAMESTASYWKPLVNIFEIKKLDYTVINARDYKNLPGKKTDVMDSEWIADLLQHGLLKYSYIPSREQRELREATRYRKSLIQERSRALNRLQKMLEGANIKITSVLSNVMGVSSRNLIEYVLDNEESMTVEQADKLVVTRIHAKIEDVVKAMDGIITPFQRTLIKEVIAHIDELTERINTMDKIVDEYMKEYEKNKKKLEKMPGLGKRTSEVILAEIGQNMNRFPTAGHLCSWAGVCPGNNESAGIKKKGKTTKGNRNLRATLNECAWSCVRSKKNRISSTYWRFVKRMGPQKAIHAVGNLILRLCYHILVSGIKYEEREKEDYEKILQKKKEQKMIKELEEKGYKIEIAS